MFSALSSRRISLAFAGIALVSMTAACGGSTNSAICTEASWSKAFTDYAAAAGAGAGDLDKVNDATAKLGADLKTLAGTADGEVATALNDLATTFEVDSRSTRTTRPPPQRPLGAWPRRSRRRPPSSPRPARSKTRASW